MFSPAFIISQRISMANFALHINNIQLRNLPLILNFLKLHIAFSKIRWYNELNAVKLVSEGAYPEMEFS